MKTTTPSKTSPAGRQGKRPIKQRNKVVSRAKTPSRKNAFPDIESFPPRPAFRAFPMRDEQREERGMHATSKFIDYAKLAPNAMGEMGVLYLEATDQSSDLKWELCLNRAGETVYRADYVPSHPEEAAKHLLMVARNATTYLAMLMDMNPELCRQIAATESQWPVIADLKLPQWQRPIADTIAKLELGKEIKGYLLSAQTSDRNVIRRWATAIFETLLHTRADFKETIEKPNHYRTTEGCPEWARKTLGLPKFTKSSARVWTKLGEEMLLQQMPDFLESPDLVAKKRSWTHRANKDSRSGKASLRAIHREAFEDFAKELKNIAPVRELWLGEW